MAFFCLTPIPTIKFEKDVILFPNLGEWNKISRQMLNKELSSVEFGKFAKKAKKNGEKWTIIYRDSLFMLFSHTRCANSSQ